MTGVVDVLIAVGSFLREQRSSAELDRCTEELLNFANCHNVRLDVSQIRFKIMAFPLSIPYHCR